MVLNILSILYNGTFFELMEEIRENFRDSQLSWSSDELMLYCMLNSNEIFCIYGWRTKIWLKW